MVAGCVAVTFARDARILLVAMLALVLPFSACSESPENGGMSPFGSRVEMAQAKASCMADKGWEVTVESDGGITFSGTAEQFDSYTQALEECNDETGASDVSHDMEITDD